MDTEKEDLELFGDKVKFAVIKKLLNDNLISYKDATEFIDNHTITLKKPSRILRVRDFLKKREIIKNENYQIYCVYVGDDCGDDDGYSKKNNVLKLIKKDKEK